VVATSLRRPGVDASHACVWRLAPVFCGPLRDLSRIGPTEANFASWRLESAAATDSFLVSSRGCGIDGSRFGWLANQTVQAGGDLRFGEGRRSPVFAASAGSAGSASPEWSVAPLADFCPRCGSVPSWWQHRRSDLAPFEFRVVTRGDRLGALLAAAGRDGHLAWRRATSANRGTPSGAFRGGGVAKHRAGRSSDLVVAGRTQWRESRVTRGRGGNIAAAPGARASSDVPAHAGFGLRAGVAFLPRHRLEERS
jgi:hypothetical protein